MIRAIRLADAEALAADVLAAADVEEVHALNTAWLREYAPDALDMVPYQMVFSAASDEAAS
jgi:hypothetical protein